MFVPHDVGLRGGSRRVAAASSVNAHATHLAAVAVMLLDPAVSKTFA
jgi:hypothetical protein